MSFTDFFDDPFSLFSGGGDSLSTQDISGLDLSSQGGPTPTQPSFLDTSQTPASDQGPENIPGAATGDPTGSSGSGIGQDLLNAAGKTLGGIGSQIGAAGKNGLMAAPPNIRRSGMQRLNEYNLPIEAKSSKPAPVADANRIQDEWIQRMRIFSGIFNQGRYTV